MPRPLAVILVAASLITATAQAAEAQGTPARPVEGPTGREEKPRWEFLVPTGAVMPTAAQGNAIRRGNLSAVQVTYLVRPNVGITSTAGWARSRDVAAAGSPRLDVFTYDVGVEVRGSQRGAGAINFTPFAGAGAGARTYNHRDLAIDATHNAGAYLSAGGELGFRRIGLRLELRNYVTGFKPLTGGGATHVRNDVVVMVGVRVTGR